MDTPTEFEWDLTKAEANLRNHHVSFDFAIGVFLDTDRLDFDASHEADGEQRRKTVGQIGSKLYTVVYTMRSTVCRLISARRSNAKEGRNYGHHP